MYVYIPALLETTVSSLEPFFRTAAIKFSGMPHKPNPPTSNLEPSGMSATASSMDANTFFDLVGRAVEKRHAII